MKATLKDIKPTIGGYEIVLRVNTTDYKPIPEYESYNVEFHKYRSRKTDRQQSYYWANLRKLANLFDCPLAEMHNQMLRWYGTYQTDEEGRIVMILQADNDDYIADEERHLEPSQETEEIAGIKYRWFRLMKPTRDLNTQEMAKLITGLDMELESINA